MSQKNYNNAEKYEYAFGSMIASLTTLALVCFVWRLCLLGCRLRPHGLYILIDTVFFLELNVVSMPASHFYQL